MNFFPQFLGKVRDILIFDPIQLFHCIRENDPFLINNDHFLPHAQGRTEFEVGVCIFRSREIVDSKFGSFDLIDSLMKRFSLA